MAFGLKVSGNMMHKIECTDCNSLMKCHIIHQTGMKVDIHSLVTLRIETLV